MLEFNIRRVLAIRKIERALDFMTKNGFTRASAVNIYSFRVTNIKVKNLEKLCLALNCTPNDFFQWRDHEGEAPLPKNHALNAVRRNEKLLGINKLMEEIPLEKLDNIEEYLRELRVKN